MMSDAKFYNAISAIENCPVPWGKELGKLVNLDRLLFECCTIRENGTARPDFELSAVEALLYLNRLHTLSWAIVLFWKPKNYSIYAPNGQRDMYKPLGAVYAAAMDLCEKLHSLEKSRSYGTAAEWFRLIIEEQTLEGFSTGQGTTKDIALLQSQNAALSIGTCPFDLPHTQRLFKTAFLYYGAGRIHSSLRAFIVVRKEWATAMRGKAWKSLIDYNGSVAIAPSGRQNPKLISPLIFNGSKTL